MVDTETVEDFFLKNIIDMCAYYGIMSRVQYIEANYGRLCCRLYLYEANNRWCPDAYIFLEVTLGEAKCYFIHSHKDAVKWHIPDLLNDERTATFVDSLKKELKTLREEQLKEQAERKGNKK